MASYVVTSRVFVPFPEGATVTDGQLAGCDVDALISAGHLTPVEPPAAPAPTPPASAAAQPAPAAPPVPAAPSTPSTPAAPAAATKE